MHGTNLHSKRRVLIEAPWALLVLLRALSLACFRSVPCAEISLERCGVLLSLILETLVKMRWGLTKPWRGSLLCLLSGI
jgi:hypothetical protein